jgi:hypothetical protein
VSKLVRPKKIRPPFGGRIPDVLTGPVHPFGSLATLSAPPSERVRPNFAPPPHGGFAFLGEAVFGFPSRPRLKLAADNSHLEHVRRECKSRRWMQSFSFREPGETFLVESIVQFHADRAAAVIPFERPANYTGAMHRHHVVDALDGEGDIRAQNEWFLDEEAQPDFRKIDQGAGHVRPERVGVAADSNPPARLVAWPAAALPVRPGRFWHGARRSKRGEADGSWKCCKPSSPAGAVQPKLSLDTVRRLGMVRSP